MQPIMPSVTVTNDSQDRIMARSGKIVGFTKSRVVWQFGFLPDSDMANAFGVSVNGFMWVIATYSGRTLELCAYCYAVHLPARYKKIIENPSK